MKQVSLADANKAFFDSLRSRDEQHEKPVNIQSKERTEPKPKTPKSKPSSKE